MVLRFVGSRFQTIRCPRPTRLSRSDIRSTTSPTRARFPDQGAFDRALIVVASALRPAGVVAFDIRDLEWGRARQDAATFAKLEPDWAIFTEFSVPAPDRFIRDITTFLPNTDGSWRRDSERHENVLVDASRIPVFLAQHGINNQRIHTVSYGKERPVAVCNDISCWSQNRRAQTVLNSRHEARS